MKIWEDGVFYIENYLFVVLLFILLIPVYVCVVSYTTSNDDVQTIKEIALIFHFKCKRKGKTRRWRENIGYDRTRKHKENVLVKWFGKAWHRLSWTETGECLVSQKKPTNDNLSHSATLTVCFVEFMEYGSCLCYLK